MDIILNDFYGLSMATTKEYGFGGDALLLAEFASPKAKDKVLDLCTGCGVVPVVMMANGFKGEITAVDIQKGAIDLCQKTKNINNLVNFNPVCMDLRNMDYPEYPAESFSLITVNPPYFAEGSGKENKEETRLLARSEAGCPLGDVIRVSSKLLKYGGRLCLCHKPERLCDIFSEMRKNGVEPKKLAMVNNDSTSKPWLILVEGKKGGHSGLNIVYMKSGR